MNWNNVLKDACECGNLDDVKKALKNGANIHADDDYALRWACENGHLDVVKYLLTSPDLKEHANIHAEQLNNNLMTACKDGDLNSAKEALAHGADIHADDDKALRHACHYGHLDVVKYLLTSPDLKEHANGHDDGLLEACYWGHLDIVKYLLISTELKVHADINTEGWGEGTPLGMACYGDNFEIVKYLLTSPELTEHADIHADNDEALYKALYYSNNLDIAQFLLTSPELTEHADVHAVKEIALHDIYDNVVCNYPDDDDIQLMLEKVSLLASCGADLGKIQPLEQWFDDYGNEFMFKTIEGMTPEASKKFMQEHGDYVLERYISAKVEIPDNLAKKIDFEQEQELYL